MSKNILVTGGLGFIGSHFCEHVAKNTDWSIKIIDGLRHAGDVERVTPLLNKYGKRLKVFFHDLRAPIHVKLRRDLSEPDYIVNFASDSHVDRSIASPGEFIRNNVDIAINMLEYARTLPGLENFVQISCYDKETRVLTTNGLKNYWEIDKTIDKVLSINNGKIEEKEIEDIIIQQYNGKMYNYKQNSLDLVVTPNHRILYQKETEEINIDEAQNIKTYYNKYTVKGKWTGEDKPLTYIEGIGNVNTLDLMYLTGLFIGDGHIHHGQRTLKSKSGLSREERVKLRDSKGCFVKCETKGLKETVICNSYRIFFEIPIGNKARNRLETVLNKLSIKHKKYKKNIYFSSKHWLEYFKQFGSKSYNKFIPKSILNLDSKYLRLLLIGLIDSDGCYRKPIQITTVSKLLRDDILNIAFKLGYNPNFRTRENSGGNFIKDRKIQSTTDAYDIFLRTKNVRFPKPNIQDYNGTIWCLRVRDNKNLIAERNGRLVFCGNTDEVYGPAPDGQAYKEWDRHIPSNPYAASKSAQEAIATAYWRTYNVPVTIATTMNNFGERQHPEKLIPKCLAALLKGDKVPIHAEYRFDSGINDCRWKAGSRTWLHARNFSDAILYILRNVPTYVWTDNEAPAKFNVAGEVELNNLEILERIGKILNIKIERGRHYEFVDFHKERPGHDRRYALNGEKLRRYGWKPPLSFSESFEKAILWMAKNPKWLGIEAKPLDGEHSSPYNEESAKLTPKTQAAPLPS